MHGHETRSTEKDCVALPQVNSIRYGRSSLKYKLAEDWNEIKKVLPFTYKK